VMHPVVQRAKKLMDSPHVEEDYGEHPLAHQGVSIQHELVHDDRQSLVVVEILVGVVVIAVLVEIDCEEEIGDPGMVDAIGPVVVKVLGPCLVLVTDDV